MTIDARIIGVEARMDNIRQTQASLGIPDSHVFLDTERRGVAWNSKRAFTFPTDATHVLVVQDDIELCKDFLGICQRIVEAHPDKVISLFPFQFLRPDSLRCGSPRNLRSPYVEANLVSGQAIIIPTKIIKPIFDLYPIYAVHDDVTIQWCARKIGVECITTLPAILQHIGDVSEIWENGGVRRTVFFDPDPSWADWESREVLPWREVYVDEKLTEETFNLLLAGRALQLRTKGVRWRLRELFADFITDEQPTEFIDDTGEWVFESHREYLRERLAEHLIARDILTIYARTVEIDGRALLLVGEKKHEAAFRLRERLGHRARVLMGSVQALQLADGRLVAHATPFTDRYPWEEKPAQLTSAPISRILILPEDVAFLSSQDLDPESLFSNVAYESLFSNEASDLLPSLIKALVLPAGLPLRLKALSLAGQIAALA